MSHTILHIDSSPLGDNSVTRKLTAKTVAQLREANADSTVITRDLAHSPLPHLSAQTLASFFTPADQRDEAQQNDVKLSDEAIDELIKADTVVIGSPMWNFGIPSVLKAWVDHVARAGLTFKYGETGPEGLLAADKKVIIVSARGGAYSEGPMKAMDFQETYLKSVLEFLGLRDISFVRAEGVAMGPDAAELALKQADEHLAQTLNKAA